MRGIPLAALGGKGLFIKEIEEALLRREIDLAVHSLKDVPCELPKGLMVGAVPRREDPRDALITRDGKGTIETLRYGAKIGTSSLRRAAQLKHIRSDFDIVPIRGNVGTRIARLAKDNLDAVVLAYAGIKRLGLEHHICQVLEPEVCLPAIAQGALAVEVRQDDTMVQNLIGTLNDYETMIAVTAERSFLETLQGGCRVPIAGLATIADGVLALAGLVARSDGSECIRRERKGPCELEAARQLGMVLAHEVLDAGGEAILREWYGVRQA